MTLREIASQTVIELLQPTSLFDENCPNFSTSQFTANFPTPLGFQLMQFMFDTSFGEGDQQYRLCSFIDSELTWQVFNKAVGNLKFFMEKCIDVSPYANLIAFLGSFALNNSGSNRNVLAIQLGDKLFRTTDLGKMLLIPNLQSTLVHQFFVNFFYSLPQADPTTSDSTEISNSAWNDNGEDKMLSAAGKTDKSNPTLSSGGAQIAMPTENPQTLLTIMETVFVEISQMFTQYPLNGRETFWANCFDILSVICRFVRFHLRPDPTTTTQSSRYSQTHFIQSVVLLPDFLNHFLLPRFREAIGRDESTLSAPRLAVPLVALSTEAMQCYYIILKRTRLSGEDVIGNNSAQILFLSGIEEIRKSHPSKQFSKRENQNELGIAIIGLYGISLKALMCIVNELADQPSQQGARRNLNLQDPSKLMLIMLDWMVQCLWMRSPWRPDSVLCHLMSALSTLLTPPDKQFCKQMLRSFARIFCKLLEKASPIDENHPLHKNSRNQCALAFYRLVLNELCKSIPNDETVTKLMKLHQKLCQADNTAFSLRAQSSSAELVPFNKEQTQARIAEMEKEAVMRKKQKELDWLNEEYNRLRRKQIEDQLEALTREEHRLSTKRPTEERTNAHRNNTTSKQPPPRKS